ncbi:MAG: type III pantothenate kinase [Muribaculaceae bacterium]|nr:type III pantothenate kinase [Muribaculaceae bacterium]
MTNLTVDIGNSRVKMEIRDESGVLALIKSENLNFSWIKEMKELYGIDNAVIASVRGDLEEILHNVRNEIDGDVMDFNRHCVKNFCDRNNYTYPIGADRVAAFLGAEYLFPGVSKLIVDAGTAMTIDVVDEKGYFCGGNISLGLQSRMKALSKATALLPQVSEIKKTTVFGTNTQDAIVAGALNGMKGELLFDYLKAKELFKVQIIILTGGDAEVLEEMVKSFEIKYYKEPDLVGKGLDFYLRSQLQNAG